MTKKVFAFVMFVFLIFYTFLHLQLVWVLSTVFSQEGVHGLTRHLTALRDIPVPARALQFCFEVRSSYLECFVALFLKAQVDCILFCSIVPINQTKGRTNLKSHP